jgi:hypothetical protein
MGILFPSVLEGQLSVSEWRALTRDGAMLDRIHYSYTILLHYFGWRLHDQETGEVDRHARWRERYAQLDQARSVYCVWTRTLRVLLELRMPNYVGRFLRFLLEEFKADRLPWLISIFDDVWWPMASECGDVASDLKAQLAKRRKRLARSSSDDCSSDDEFFLDDTCDDALEPNAPTSEHTLESQLV